MVDLYKIASKMRLMGDAVQIIGDNHLIHSTNDKDILYTVVDNKLKEILKFDKINWVKNSEVCIAITKHTEFPVRFDAKHLININGTKLMENLVDLKELCDGVLVADISANYKSIIGHDGMSLVNKIFTRIRKVDTIIGTIIDCDRFVGNNVLYLLEKNELGPYFVTLIELTEQIKDNSYTIKYDRINIYNKSGDKRVVMLK